MISISEYKDLIDECNLPVLQDQLEMFKDSIHPARIKIKEMIEQRIQQIEEDELIDELIGYSV